MRACCENQPFHCSVVRVAYLHNRSTTWTIRSTAPALVSNTGQHTIKRRYWVLPLTRSPASLSVSPTASPPSLTAPSARAAPSSMAVSARARPSAAVSLVASMLACRDSCAWRDASSRRALPSSAASAARSCLCGERGGAGWAHGTCAPRTRRQRHP